MDFCRMLALGVALAAGGSGWTAERTVFSWNFGENSALSGWNYFNDTAEKAKFAFADVAGRRCLKTHGLYGISHRLDSPVTIDGSVRRVTAVAEVLLPASPVHVVPFALSTRAAVVPNTSRPFDGVEDSGVELKACIFDSPRHQQLAIVLDGKEVVHTTGSVSPRNMGVADAWVTWTLVYDNAAKTVFAYTSLEPDRPRLKLYHVDLAGKTLRSVFLPAQNVCHRGVRVTVE